MFEQVNKPKENKSKVVANSVAQKKVKQGFGFLDNRAEGLYRNNSKTLQRVVYTGQGHFRKELTLDEFARKVKNLDIGIKNSGDRQRKVMQIFNRENLPLDKAIKLLTPDTSNPQNQQNTNQSSSITSGTTNSLVQEGTKPDTSAQEIMVPQIQHEQQVQETQPSLMGLKESKNKQVVLNELGEEVSEVSGGKKVKREDFKSGNTYDYKLLKKGKASEDIKHKLEIAGIHKFSQVYMSETLKMSVKEHGFGPGDFYKITFMFVINKGVKEPIFEKIQNKVGLPKELGGYKYDSSKAREKEPKNTFRSEIFKVDELVDTFKETPFGKILNHFLPADKKVTRVGTKVLKTEDSNEHSLIEVKCWVGEK
ncbi:hypothetical protein [uncultured Shewanella sp.]|uniref:hypothetical protein n=1 Tax=uncultured Shewanella sp. TaxID=173975 RepID=UPI00263616A1|nr:hypothetical protein [uncultured Shewanella sp.]